MTKKHFVVIARILKMAYIGKMSYWSIANELARYFETINPSFNRAAFMNACDISEPIEEF